VGETVNPSELWAGAVVCECDSLTFLEFWDSHMWVVSLLVFFGLAVLASCANSLGRRAR
jgi:hypothetical protein